jgi:mono/diheme cytochrome c family protein
MRKLAVCVVVGFVFASLGFFARSSMAAPPPLPKGVTQDMVTQGNQIFHNQACAACHSPTGAGTVLGPDLTGSKWIWGDGSYASISKVVKEGVPTPKQFHTPMPPMGGAALTADQISAVSAYVWTLSHH